MRTSKLAALLLSLTASIACAPAPSSAVPQGAAPESKTRVGGLEVGQAAPDFSLPGTDAGEARLSQALERGPVVLVFYRGDWCPHCRHQLAEMSERLGDFESRGATLLAVSVDDVETSEGLVDRLGLKFPLYSDADLSAIAAFEVEHTGHDIARPSTFVIAQDGTIAWAWVGERAGDRPKLDVILSAIPTSATPQR